MKTGIYHSNFKTHWQIRAKTKVTLKTGPQDEYSIPKKKITLQVVPVRPDEDWVTGRDKLLEELARDSRFLQMSTALLTYNYEQARETEGTDPTNYHTTNFSRQIRILQLRWTAWYSWRNLFLKNPNLFSCELVCALCWN